MHHKNQFLKGKESLSNGVTLHVEVSPTRPEVKKGVEHVSEFRPDVLNNFNNRATQYL